MELLLEKLIVWPYFGLIIAGGYFLRIFNWPKWFTMQYVVLVWALVAGVIYYLFDSPDVQAAWFITYFVATSAYELLIRNVEKWLQSKFKSDG